MEDPSTDLPATTEPVAHIAHAANPTPSHTPIHNHPPYAEMITAAIMAMKEKDGSSRQAIAKYIEKEYPNLPPSHSALLTHHLKRLKNIGQLVMLKHSYMLPRSVPFPLFPPGNTTAATFDGPKRRPGRPPKPKPEVQPNGVVPQQNAFVSVGLADGLPTPGPTFGFGGLPTTGPTFGFGGLPTIGPTFGLASGPMTTVPTFGVVGGPPTTVPTLGQVNGPPAKKGPGRPPKVKSVVVVAESVGQVDGSPSTVSQRRPGRPPKVKTGPVGAELGGPTLGKSRRGRPVKPKLLSILMGNVGPKRGRGRPPSVIGSRPRGRPKKGAASTVGYTGRPRGRPPKNVAVNGVAGGGGVLPVKRPGPPKMGGAKKPRKLSGRPLGRPKKSASVAAIQASEQQQLMPYQDLKARVEHFQSRIKQAVSVVKPYLNNETAVIAVGALQELEELASMDVSTPLNLQGQEPLLQN